MRSWSSQHAGKPLKADHALPLLRGHQCKLIPLAMKMNMPEHANSGDTNARLLLWRINIHMPKNATACVALQPPAAAPTDPVNQRDTYCAKALASGCEGLHALPQDPPPA